MKPGSLEDDPSRVTLPALEYSTRPCPEPSQLIVDNFSLGGVAGEDLVKDFRGLLPQAVF